MHTLVCTKTIVQTILIATRPFWKNILDNSIKITVYLQLMHSFSKTENSAFLKTLMMKFEVKIYEKDLPRSSCLVKLQAFRL